MEIKYFDGVDKGLPNWRVRLHPVVKRHNGPLTLSGIHVVVENFEYGFREGGDCWNKVSIFTGDTYKGTKDDEITIITKDKSRIEEFKKMIVEAYYAVIDHNIVAQRRIVKRELEQLDYYCSIKNFMSVDVIRDEKIDLLLS